MAEVEIGPSSHEDHLEYLLYDDLGHVVHIASVANIVASKQARQEVSSAAGILPHASN